MKRISTLLIFALCTCLAAISQTPVIPDGGEFFDPLAGASMESDSPIIVNEIANLKANNNEKLEKVQPPDSQDIAIAKTENEIKLLTLRNQRLRLEEELKQLQNKKELTPEEKEIIALKNQNLKLIIEHERLLLEEELDNAKNENLLQNYPKEAIYGQQFFRDSKIKLFQKTNEILPSDNYILGPGDIVQLEVWGYANYSQTMAINDQGYIQISKVLKLYVQGLTLEQARAMIGNRLRSITNLNTSSYSVNVTRSRVISINIIGEVFRPGTYTIPAINSAFNGLASMGGPTNIGSVRNIYVKRNGKIVDSLDVYNFIADQNKSKEVFLQNNDYLIVKPAEYVVEIGGAVQRPAVYEIKKGEKLSDLFRFAAGLKSNAYLKDVLVTRIIKGYKYERFSVNFDSLQKAGKDYALQNGDVIQIKNITDDDNFLVQVSGAVNIPGQYKIRKGDRISDLLRLSNGLLKDAYKEKAYLIRTNSDLTQTYISFNLNEVISDPGSIQNVVLDKQDNVTIYKLQHFIDFNDSVFVTGSVRMPKKFRFMPGIKVAQAIFMAGGVYEETNMARAYIIRTGKDFEKDFISFDPSKALADSNSSSNIRLQARDEVHLFSKAEFLREYNVSVEGAVNKPGFYKYADEARISDLIDFAGGMAEFAFTDRAILYRREPGEIKARNISVSLTEIFKNPSSNQNLILSRNDRLKIFSTLEFVDDYNVEVYGEVRKPGNLPYTESLTLKDVLYLVGGFKLNAIKSRLEVVRTIQSNGEEKEPVKTIVFSVFVGPNLLLDAESENFKIEPFDMIFVRSNPLFNDVRTIFLGGAVMYPGVYALTGTGEKLSSIIKRAGGFKPEAQVNGSSMIRIDPNGNQRDVIIFMKKAISRKKSYYNFYLMNGDVINVPISSSLVTISGAIGLSDKKEISAIYKPGKRAGNYIKNYAGGFSANAVKRFTQVKYSNGRVRATRNYIIFKVYPKVREGSQIIVKEKIPKVKSRNQGGNQKGLNVDDVLAKTTSRLTAILTVLSLYKIATQ